MTGWCGGGGGGATLGGGAFPVPNGAITSVSALDGTGCACPLPSSVISEEVEGDTIS